MYTGLRLQSRSAGVHAPSKFKFQLSRYFSGVWTRLSSVNSTGSQMLLALSAQK